MSLSTHAVNRNDRAYKTFTPGDPGGYFFHANGSLNEDQARLVARSYPVAVQGTLLSMAFNDSTSVLDFSFDLDPNVGAPTEVYFCAACRYQDGVTLAVTPPGALTKLNSTSPNVMVLGATPGASAGPVSVSLRPR